MLKYTLRKLFAIIPKLLAISIIFFVILEMLPGDPLSRTIGPDVYEEMTEVQREAQREALGLNDPAPVRYFRWLGNVLQGDLGYSTLDGQSISAKLAGRLPFTIEMTAYALVIGAILGVLMGFVAAIKKNTILDYTCSTISVLGVSLPEFFFGLLFVIIFSLKLQWFPAGGRMSVGDDSFWGRLPYMVLPIATMTVGLTAALVRYTRTSMLDTLDKDYIKTARSKGLSETTVNLKHVFRTSMAPVLTTLIMRIPRLVGGSVVVETVFNYTGIGQMSLVASNAGDAPVVLITTMATSALTLLASTLVDLMVAWVDPRVRYE